MMAVVSIFISRDGSLYRAEVTPPDSDQTWVTATPLSRDALIVQLRLLGCHTTDMSDAFYAANPAWLAEA